jgi:hypothetical protein
MMANSNYNPEGIYPKPEDKGPGFNKSNQR